MYMDIMYRGGYDPSTYAEFERAREDYEDYMDQLDEEELEELFSEVA